MIQIESLFSAKPLPKTAQFNSKRALVSDKGIGSLIARRLRPQLKTSRIASTHLQMLQRHRNAPRRSIVGPDAERFHLRKMDRDLHPETQKEDARVTQ